MRAEYIQDKTAEHESYFIISISGAEKGQEIGLANRCEVANVRRTVFRASSLTSTSFSKSAQWCQVAWDDPPFNEWRDYCKLIFHNLPSPSGKAQSGFAF